MKKDGINVPSLTVNLRLINYQHDLEMFEDVVFTSFNTHETLNLSIKILLKGAIPILWTLFFKLLNCGRGYHSRHGVIVLMYALIVTVGYNSRTYECRFSGLDREVQREGSAIYRLCKAELWWIPLYDHSFSCVILVLKDHYLLLSQYSWLCFWIKMIF